MQRPKPYILWDWNGTLLDDTEAALATLNEMITVRGGQPIGMEFYRDHFAFPVRPFYDKIGIVAHNEDEWNGIAHEYHEVYGRQPKKLNPLAVTALEMAKEAGCRQSIVSALRQDLLEADMARNGVTKYFERICGSDNLDGASKLERARVLLRTLSETVPSGTHFILIGDALHDMVVVSPSVGPIARARKFADGICLEERFNRHRSPIVVFKHHQQHKSLHGIPILYRSEIQFRRYRRNLQYLGNFCKKLFHVILL